MLQAGFAGFGRMGITHFSILNTHPSVRVASICDQSKTMLGILDKYLDIEIYSDYQEMIDRSKLDFIVISTPADSHSEIIQCAIDKDLHIFCEKPFVLNTNEGSQILNSAQNKHLVNQVGYVNRFNSVFMEVKRLLELDTIGDIKNFSSEMYGATVLKDSKQTWRSKRYTGGGCMNEFASHCIDLVTYLFGVPDRISGSVLQQIYSTQVEDLVCSMFSYSRGINGSIMVNWSDESVRRPTNIITIFGTHGKIIADKHAYKIYLRSDNPHNGFRKGWNTRYITDFSDNVRFYVRGNEFTRQLDYFIDCIEKRSTENLSSFLEAFKTDTIMQQIIADANGSTQRQQQNSIQIQKRTDTKSAAPRWKFWQRDR
jgi:predicted dehydrogenase